MIRLALTKSDKEWFEDKMENIIHDAMDEQQKNCEHRFDDRYMKKNDKKKNNPGNNPGNNPNNKTLLSLVNKNRDIIFFVILLGAGLGGFLIAIGVVP